MKTLASLAAAVMLAAATASAQNAASPTAAAAETPAQPRQLELATKPWTGDFDGMFERRHIRVLVPHSRTLFYVDKGQERGVVAELMRDFERWLNQKHKAALGNRPITLYLIPTTRDQLLPRLHQGLGDLAAGNLTVTPKRLAQADFFAPEDLRSIKELIVTGPGAPELATLDDLSGKTIHARPVTSYHESLLALNERLKAGGKPPARIAPLPNALEDEDKLEMLNAGLLEIVVVDDWKARIWAKVLPKIRVREDLVVRDAGRRGWAFRKGSPKLVAEIEEFYTKSARKQGTIPYREAMYAKRIMQFENNTGNAEWKRFEQILALFRTYGTQYGFDPIMLAAQGYQESRLRQDAKSHVGAVGVMQVMPATGKELGVGDIHQLEANIHAGAKYMDKLMTRYFKEAKFTPTNRALFAFASYNAGPGNITKMRRLATERGFDPDKWFNHVEVVTADKIGIETTTYVRNIYKYYTAYKLVMAARAEQLKAREAVQKAQ